MNADEPHLRFEKVTINKKGELLAVVSLIDNRNLLFQDHINLTKDSSIYPVTYTAVSTGLRQAELLG